VVRAGAVREAREVRHPPRDVDARLAEPHEVADQAHVVKVLGLRHGVARPWLELVLGLVGHRLDAAALEAVLGQEALRELGLVQRHRLPRPVPADLNPRELGGLVRLVLAPRNVEVRLEEAHELGPNALALHREEHVVDVNGADEALRHLLPRRVRVRVRPLERAAVVEVQPGVELVDHPRHEVLLPDAARLHQAVDVALHVGDEPPAAPRQAAVAPLGRALELGRHLGELQVEVVAVGGRRHKSLLAM